MLIRNTLANLAGQLLYPILQVALVPFYIHYLGLEGYGLIGFLSMLVALMGIFTKGLASAIQREIARREAISEDRGTLRQLVRTFELTYWFIGVILAVVLGGLSGVISTKWLQTHTISQATINGCITLLAIRIALAFPNGLYQAVFIGTQRQVLGNILNCLYALLSAISGVAVILIWKSILGFYAVDVINACLSLVILRYWSRRVLPPPEESLNEKFDWGELQKLWSLSLGMIWAHGIGLAVTQMDRIIISKLLPMASLGTYTASIAGGRLLGMIYSPFLIAVYPQTCQIARKGQEGELSYHLMNNSKIIMIVSMTVGLPIAFFSREILEIWTRNALVVQEGAGIFTLFAFANIFTSLASVLYQGQWALGLTRFVVLFHSLGVIWYPLALWFLIKNMGLIGAAWAGISYSILSWLFNLVVTNVILLKQAYLGEYLRMIIKVSAVDLAVIELTRYLANCYFLDRIWGRVIVAGMGGMAIFFVSSVICFGFGRLLVELQEVRRKLSLKILGNQT